MWNPTQTFSKRCWCRKRVDCKHSQNCFRPQDFSNVNALLTTGTWTKRGFLNNSEWQIRAHLRWQPSCPVIVACSRFNNEAFGRPDESPCSTVSVNTSEDGGVLDTQSLCQVHHWTFTRSFAFWQPYGSHVKKDGQPWPMFGDPGNQQSYFYSGFWLIRLCRFNEISYGE